MKNVSLKLIFVLWFLAMIAFAFITNPEHKPIRMDEVSFKALESESLYFKNVRQFYYALEEREDAQFELFTLRSLANYKRDEQFLPIIVNNWRMDEAYLKFEHPALDQGEGMKFVTSNADTFELNRQTSFDQFLLGVKLYTAIADEAEIYHLKGERAEPLFLNGNERNAFMKTLKDYYKLVGKL